MITTYLFVHDEDIVIGLEKTGKMKIFQDYKYVFVGYKTVDKIKNLNNLIVCRDYDNNIEKYKYAVSYTGWYCLKSNNLVNSDVILLEWDTNYKQDIFQKISKTIDSYDIIGFIKRPLSYHFYEHIENVMYKGDLIYKDFTISKLGDIDWSITTNCCMNQKTFTEYVDDFNLVFEELKHNPSIGHIHERYITLFSYFKNKRTCVIDNVLYHYQLHSYEDYYYLNFFQKIFNNFLF